MIYIHYSPQHQQYEIRITFDPVYYVTASPLDWSAPLDKPFVVNSSVDKHTISEMLFTMTDEYSHGMYSSGLSDHEIIYTVARKEIENLDVPGMIKNVIDDRVRKEIEKSYQAGPPMSMPSAHLYSSESTKTQLSSKAGKLPGLSQEVRLPCECPGVIRVVLRNAVLHLNDSHKWTREKIADWMDELADKGEIDIDFPTPDVVDFDREKVGNAGPPPGQDLMHIKTSLDDAALDKIWAQVKQAHCSNVLDVNELENPT